MKHFNQKSFNILVLTVLFALSVLLYFAFSRINNQTSLRDSDIKQQLSALQHQAAINASNAQFIRPVISVTENAVYLPGIRLKLPLEEQSLSMLYSVREVGNPDKKLSKTYDVASQDFLTAATNQSTVLSCIPVRFSFESKPNPFNPHEQSVKPVNLSDGRILQIYSYSNSSCNNLWSQSKTEPDKIAAMLQKASSY